MFTIFFGGGGIINQPKDNRTILQAACKTPIFYTRKIFALLLFRTLLADLAVAGKKKLFESCKCVSRFSPDKSAFGVKFTNSNLVNLQGVLD